MFFISLFSPFISYSTLVPHPEEEEDSGTSFLLSPMARHRSNSTNNDASRRSRMKKRLTTEVRFECYEADEAERDALQEDEEQLQVIVALLEDKVFALSGNARLIDFYRDFSCLS